MNPINDKSADDGAGAGMGLGVACTAVLATAYAGFVLIGAIAPNALAATVYPGGVVTWAFVYGLSIIALGVALTFVYAFFANRQDHVVTSKDRASLLLQEEGTRS